MGKIYRNLEINGYTPITIEKGHGTVILSVDFSEDLTFSMVFRNTDDIAKLSVLLMEAASKMWPNDPLVKEYLED